MMQRTTLTILLVAAPLLWSADPDLVPRQMLSLSLKRAVELATSPEGNTNIQLEQQELRIAKARSQEARAPLLPNVESYAQQSSLIRSLAALGSEAVKLPFNL